VTRGRWIRRAGIAIVFAAVTGGAAEAIVPSELQANILLRMFGYERSLRSRAGNSVGIAIVFNAADKSSVRAEESMLRAFEALQPQTVQGMSFVVLPYPYKDAAGLTDFLEKKGVDAVYLSPGLEADLETVRGVCQQRKTVSIGATRAAVEKGIAVAVVAKGDSPRILVNLPVSQSLGMDLDPKLLQLAEVLR
jgi:hypothetical protein